MGKNIEPRPSYLAADNAKYSLGVNRGPLATVGDGDAKLEPVASAGGVSLATTNRTMKEKLLHHWKRFWFLYLVGNVILLAIMLPIL